MAKKYDELIQDDFDLDQILQEVSAWTEDGAPPKAASLKEQVAPIEEPPAQEPPLPGPSELEEEAANALVEAIEAENREREEAKEEEAPPPPPDNITRIGPPPAPGEDAEEGEPEKVISLFQPKEPETIREAAQVVSEKAKVWWRLRQDKLKVPKVKVKTPRFRLTEWGQLPPPEDVPPKELAKAYSRGLGGMRLQCAGALLLSLALFLLAFLFAGGRLPLLEALHDVELLTQVSLVLFVLSAGLSYPVLVQGVTSLIKGRPGMEFGAALAVIAVLVDAATMLFAQYRPMSLPLFAPVSCVLGFQMWGIYWKKRALRLSCRTAAMAAEPDLMTCEPSQWNGKAVYRRRPGAIDGFGSQIQQEDGAQRRFRFFTPLITLLAIALSIAATVLSEQPELLFWSLSGTLTAACTLSGCLCFSMPFRGLSRRFSKLGVALAGWEGAKEARSGNGILVDDTDLFPPGSIQLISYRLFNGLTAEQVLSVTASLIRAAGSGLDPLFFNLLRTEEGAYVALTGLNVQNEGISAQAMGEKVLVGNAGFLERNGVDVPSGVRVKTGVFCAIGGVFAGQFILEYTMHKGSMPAMEAMMGGGIVPVLIATDFNMIPSLLKRQFKFPWDKMSFPDISQRIKLAKAPFPRDGRLMAVLCLEGLAPLAMAAAGAQRLVRAVRMCVRLTCLSAVIGVLLAFYLSSAAALTSLSAVSLTLYLILWFLPTVMISGWVNQF